MTKFSISNALKQFIFKIFAAPPTQTTVTTKLTPRNSSLAPANLSYTNSNRRLISVTGRRDHKLMSVLQARRSAAQTSPNKWRSTEDCERTCRTSNNDEYCRLRCSRDARYSRHNSSTVVEYSTPDSNLIAQNGDEFLDTEESVNVGLYFAEPGDKKEGRRSNNGNFLIILKDL